MRGLVPIFPQVYDNVSMSMLGHKERNPTTVVAAFSLPVAMVGVFFGALNHWGLKL